MKQNTKDILIFILICIGGLSVGVAWQFQGIGKEISYLASLISLFFLITSWMLIKIINKFERRNKNGKDNTENRH